MKRKINTLCGIISLSKIKQKTTFTQQIYLPFVILEIYAVLVSSTPKIPFNRTSEKYLTTSENFY